MKTIQRIAVTLVAILLAGGLFSAPAHADEPAPVDPLEQCQSDLVISQSSADWWEQKAREWETVAGSLSDRLKVAEAKVTGVQAALDHQNELGEQWRLSVADRDLVIQRQDRKISKQARVIDRLRAQLAAARR